MKDISNSYFCYASNNSDRLEYFHYWKTIDFEKFWSLQNVCSPKTLQRSCNSRMKLELPLWEKDRKTEYPASLYNSALRVSILVLFLVYARLLGMWQSEFDKKQISNSPWWIRFFSERGDSFERYDRPWGFELLWQRRYLRNTLYIRVRLSINMWSLSIRLPCIFKYTL